MSRKHGLSILVFRCTHHRDDVALIDLLAVLVVDSRILTDGVGVYIVKNSIATDIPAVRIVAIHPLAVDPASEFYYPIHSGYLSNLIVSPSTMTES